MDSITNEVLERLSFDPKLIESLSDEERTSLRNLCDRYRSAETLLDENDYKRKITQFIKSYGNNN